MKSDLLIHGLLLVLIVAMAGLIARLHLERRNGPVEAVPVAAVDIVTTTALAMTPAARLTPDPYKGMGGSTLFATIIKRPTPTPPPPRRTRTPKPPPDIKKVVAHEKWRLADVWKGKATIEVQREKKFIELGVGDSRTINYQRQNCKIEIIELDQDSVTATLGFGDQRMTLKAF